MNHGTVGVRLQNIDGGRHQCIAVANGAAVDQVELLEIEAARAGEGNPIFTPCRWRLSGWRLLPPRARRDRGRPVSRLAFGPNLPRAIGPRGGRDRLHRRGKLTMLGALRG